MIASHHLTILVQDDISEKPLTLSLLNFPAFKYYLLCSTFFRGRQGIRENFLAGFCAGLGDYKYSFSVSILKKGNLCLFENLINISSVVFGPFWRIQIILNSFERNCFSNFAGKLYYSKMGGIRIKAGPRLRP